MLACYFVYMQFAAVKQKIFPQIGSTTVVFANTIAASHALSIVPKCTGSSRTILQKKIFIAISALTTSTKAALCTDVERAITTFVRTAFKTTVRETSIRSLFGVSKHVNVPSSIFCSRSHAHSKNFDVVCARATGPRGCGLEEFDTDHDGFSCDKCKRRFPASTTMFGCRTCNFDLCVDCSL